MNERGQLGFASINTQVGSNLPAYPTPQWQLITEESQFTAVLPELMQTRAIGLDIETSGLDPHEDAVRLVQIAAEGHPVYIIDCSQVTDLQFLAPLFAARWPVKVIHNAVFELKFLENKHRMSFCGIYDTMLASRLLGNGFGYRHGLDKVVERELGFYLSKTMQQSNWSSSTLSGIQYDYAAKDAAVLLDLRKSQIPKLQSEALVEVAKLEFDCTRAMASMMFNGVYIDLDLLDQQFNKLSEQAVSYEFQLRQYFGDINLQSPQQLNQALKKRGINADSTRESALREFVVDHPEIELLQQYKSLLKIISSALQPLRANINPVTHRVHSDFHQMGASSGRMSCGNPNMQNMPRRSDIRSLVAAPPGHKLIIADYSQIELRIIAEISEDPAMIAAYREGQDIHRLTASLFSDKKPEDITREERQKAKAVNFGLVYGMGAQGLVRYAKGSYGVEMTLAEAEYIKSSFFRTYQGIADWHRRIRRTMDQVTFNATLSGRKRYYKTDKRFISELYNTPVQGTGADILKLALTILHERLQATSGKIVNCVHDEIVVECLEQDAAVIAEIVRNSMEDAGHHFIKKVPIVADVLIAPNWSEK